jgi:catechol 2,3-dioxygenase
VETAPEIAPVIAPSTGMGAVELTVADLDRTLDYWQREIGLRVLERAGGRASLGTDTEVLRFVEEPGAQPDTGHTGLYHVALLLPDRPSLARWLAHAARDRVSLTGLSDHAVSEAIYLRDPDHHGIEIYADRPRELWDGKVAELMTTIPLDVDDLLGELDDPAAEPFEGLADGTVVGHTHLRVADVDRTIAFYRDVLGFPLTAEFRSMAAFLGAGGYHHHVGANIWESSGASPAPAGSATLRHAEILLPDRDELDRVVARVADAGQEPQSRDGGVLVRDPSGNGLLLAARS